MKNSNKNANLQRDATYVNFEGFDYANDDYSDYDTDIDIFSVQEYACLKRKLIDAETESEEELLLLVYPGTSHDAISDGSLSSSISQSDKSISADNDTIEIYEGDAPFEGKCSYPCFLLLETVGQRT